MAKIQEYKEIEDILGGEQAYLLVDNGTETNRINAKNFSNSSIDLLEKNKVISNLDLKSLPTKTPPSQDIPMDPITKNDVLLIGNENGETKISKMDSFLYGYLDAVVPLEMRRNIWRGKNLGSSMGPSGGWIHTNIANGTFKGLFLGDYWEVVDQFDNTKTHMLRIVDFDYWYGTGRSGHECTRHHVVVMPDQPFYSGKLFDTLNDEDDDSYNKGYYSSKANVGGQNSMVSAFDTPVFNCGVLGHDEPMVKLVGKTKGVPLDVGYQEVNAILPNEMMIFGCPVSMVTNDGDLYSINANQNVYATIIINDTTQLSAFRINRKLINSGVNYWLRDNASSISFSLVDKYGFANSARRDLSAGMRPVIALI